MKITSYHKGQSLKYLKKLLTNSDLSKKEEKKLRNLITKKEKEVKKLSEQFIESSLLRLACVRLIADGRAEKKTIEGQTKYIQDPILVLETMREIVDTSNKAKKKKLLTEFCSND